MLIKILIFIAGSIIGSFLNVCIYRLPRQESIAYPASHCVYCNHNIYWYDNIPFISYIFLRGKCRFCARPISFRYFIVEFITGSLLLTFYLFFGFTAKFFAMSLLFACLIASAFIDFEHKLIPDILSVPAMFIGLVLCTLFPSIAGEEGPAAGALNSFLGILAGGGSIYAMGILGKLAFKKEAMGGGDVKLMAAIGSFLGWKLVLLVFFLAPFFGATAGIAEKIRIKAEVIPYGPYLSLASLIAVLWGEKILDYLLFRF